MNRRRLILSGIAFAAFAASALSIATYRGLHDIPDDIAVITGSARKSQVLARDGTPLSYTRENEWNTSDIVALNNVPVLLQRAFIMAEDRHFFEHHGIDWTARLAAGWQNLRAGATVRGASSITEQTVRILHPRARTLWSRWLESFEASRLESRFSKTQILTFYLNQVPYADRRRGVVQAARLYFDRGLDTLSPAEQLALAVLVRSPMGMDLRRNEPRARRAIGQLADRMMLQGDLTPIQREQVRADPLKLSAAGAVLDASHFVSRALTDSGAQQPVPDQIRTTLDPNYQRITQRIVDSALARLSKRGVKDAAVLVIDHRRNEIQAWVVGQSQGSAGYDAVLTPRQPGSTMKPLLYALALEQGWTAATLIDDSELAESVGTGQHTFHNYSHLHYGPLRLREALGNSLNIPAVKTLKFVGQNRFLERLHAVGITSLTQHPDFYGDGLALGNGEVSLYEMAQAYTVLARQGRYRPLTMSYEDGEPRTDVKIFSAEIATLIGNILADPDARMLEFGHGLQFPVETAIKTGTSTDYRDAWAIAFDYRHTVAVWMGNLDGSAMNGVTGAVGPAMVLRSLFSELNRDQDTHDLALSRTLVQTKICRRDGRLADDTCASTTEWFLPGTLPVRSGTAAVDDPQYRLLQPTVGLLVAHDPRIPSELEALPMQVAPVPGLRRVDWYVDGQQVSSTTVGRYAWPLVRGRHAVYTRIWDDARDAPHVTELVRFQVH
jgi:penicillin-binding protein 1C